ncbi:MAG TPA: hypothetical protein VG367_14290 [Mucilaginibacter sp.]|nr:hypothetical protein [Mucilaginibacter sp.]
MKRLLIIGLWLVCSLKCFSTCIVIYVADNGHIYVAADSKRTFYFADNKQPESICKIHKVGQTYFAIAGIDDGALLQNTNQSLTENTNPDTAISRFGRAMTAHYDHLLADMQLYYPEKIDHFLENGLAQVSFFGFYNGKPRIIDIEFVCRLGVNGKVITSYSVQEIRDLAVIGMSRDIAYANYKDMPSNYTRNHNPDLYVEKLVEIEIKSQPQSVGGPVDVLELQPGKEIWIRKNETAAAY